MTERSCGTVPYTVKNGIVYYLMIKAKDDGYCGFPKGHAEKGESEEETALRETFEETSLKPHIDCKFRHEIAYRMKNGNRKIVVYFLADFKGQMPRRNGSFEDFEYLMLPFEAAYKQLTFESAKQMLKAANSYLMD